MNIKRFHAPTSREALAKARMAFGDGTLILSNRPTATGVEVVATAEDTLASLDEDLGDEGNAVFAPANAAATTRPTSSFHAAPSAPTPAARTHQMAADSSLLRSPVEEDTEQLAMSTLSFQDYVRERMLRRRHEALTGPSEAATLFERSRSQQPEQVRQQEPERERTRERVSSAPVARHNPLRVTPAEHPVEPPRRRQEAVNTNLSQPNNQQSVMNELHSMKDLIEERFNTLAWLGQARQNPIQTHLMLKMIRGGYSPSLARLVLERLPEDMSAGDSVRWLMEVLERNLKTDIAEAPLYEQGGIFAMVGSTGVGKTTTTAKLAAMCASIHGPASVGLITLDTYRVGAHDQLRTYGRMLGVVAHLAHDRAALQDLLGLLSSKRMVLIDTTGIAPRDPRKSEILDVLELPYINRLLVLNASCHGDTLDDVLTAFKTDGSQQAILSKVDEAVKLGPALDALIRHQMVLRGVTNGQRVPEDWERADARSLISTSMKAPAKSAFDPKATDLNFFFSHASDSAADEEMFHA